MNGKYQINVQSADAIVWVVVVVVPLRSTSPVRVHPDFIFQFRFVWHCACMERWKGWDEWNSFWNRLPNGNVSHNEAEAERNQTHKQFEKLLR